MHIQHAILSQDDHATDGQAPAPMRALTTDELREIVGGPEIKNGGGGGVLPGDTNSVVGG